MGRRSGFTRTELLIVIGIILVIAAIAVPGLLSSERASNERNASTALKTLTSAEADYRANDRDWNHVNDFWTADVKGLYTMTSAEYPGAGKDPKDVPIKLIDLDVATADADPAVAPAGGENLPLTQFGPHTMRKGYWYVALIADNTLTGTAEATYRMDTGGTPAMGKVHNTSKFGFMAFPDSWSKGKYYFQVNENNTIFRQEKSVRLGEAVPPGLKGIDPECLYWPDDSKLKSYWSRLD